MTDSKEDSTTDNSNSDEKNQLNNSDTNNTRFTDSQLLGGTFLMVLIVFGGAIAMGGGVPTTGDASDFNYTDWANETEITDVQAATQSHATTLTSTSYKIEAVINSQTADQEQESSFTYSYNNNSQSAYGIQDAQSNQTETYDDYTENQIYVANGFSSEENATFEREYLTQSPFTGGSVVTQFLTFSTVEAVETTDDGSVVVYNITGVDEEFSEQINVSLSGEMHLHEDGYFNKVNVSIEQSASDTTSNQDITVSDVGSTTVEEPAWLSQAKEQTERAEEPTTNSTASGNETE